MRPQLPVAGALTPYLQRIDAARYYSNYGPLLRELEAHLAKHFGVASDQLALLANGTVALSAALSATRATSQSTCLLPAWTFVGSAAAVWAANLVPHFADVSEQTWMLDAQAVRQRADLSNIGAVMVVSAFGAPVDTATWDSFSAETGIPVVIDGAAAFDSVARVPCAAPGRSPIMISLHATKVFGIGEGAVVLSTDEALVHRVRQIGNFGIWGSPEGQILGYNGKLSEYHAAVGLAALDGWNDRRAALAKLTQTYRTRLATFPDVATLPGYGNGWVSSYCNVVVDRALPIIERLNAMGVETRRWWRSGVAVQRAYRDFPRDPMPVTEDLARRVYGLPFFHDLPEADVEYVLGALRAALDAGA